MKKQKTISPWKLFLESLSSLTVNKTRSGLTILGIIIGIGSVIAMISVGQGAKDVIAQNIQSIGSNLVVVVPKAKPIPGSLVNQGDGSRTLRQDDANAMQEKLTMVKAIAPEISLIYQVVAKDKNVNATVIGTVPAYQTVRKSTIEVGSFISDSHVKSFSRVAVLGSAVRDNLFGTGVDPVGKQIRIDGETAFKVIGVIKAKGGRGTLNQDNMVFVPVSAIQQFLEGDKFLTTINIEAIDEKSIPAVERQVTAILLERHKIADLVDANFSVLNQKDLVATASSVANIFTALLASVASISLLVGGIGIMNMMLMNVTERTREIGLRKALGARKRDIAGQFLFESILVTFLGGLAGIAFGWVIAEVISRLAHLPTTVTWSSVLLAVGVSAAIGIIFGYYPALKAARLNPIVALRFE